MIDLANTPGWVVAFLFGALITLAFQAGSIRAEIRFLRGDANRYSWLRRQAWSKDGAPMQPHELDRLADVGQVCDGLSMQERSETPNK